MHIYIFAIMMCISTCYGLVAKINKLLREETEINQK